MAIELPPLPYAKNALEPYISAETLDYHYGKHHQAYVTNLNKLLPGTSFADKSLEEIVAGSSGAMYNNAAQIFNHTFYWNCLSPTGGGAPQGALGDAIAAQFGSFATFQEAFTTACTGLFGSGWVFLTEGRDGRLAIESLPNAGCPLTTGSKPLLTCDVWEHAYYIDYRNARPQYVEIFWKRVNWDFANQNLIA